MLKKKSSEETPEVNIQQQIQKIIENTKKEFGEKSVSTLEESGLGGRKILSTGSLLLDKIIEAGGYIYGTIIEIFGQPGVGKSTLALHAVSECQKQGKIAAYIDLENKLGKNNEYAESIGVNAKELIKFNSLGGEEVFRFINKNIEEGVSLFVVDSVAALVPEANLKEGSESQGIASKARLISERLPITNLKMRDKDVILIFVNQIREDLSSNFFGPKLITPGGWSLEHHVSLRIMMRPRERIQKDAEYIGIKTQASIIKNSFGSLKKKAADLEIIFGKGVQKEREIIDLAVEKDIIQKSGNWYSYGEKKLGNGKENTVDYLLENPEIYQEIREIIIKRAIN
ncbi:recombinase RecA [endosymbiont GvMRE of Glomus versiforme]|uniref:recombinase RecA n=1 Tax=endosymbiont GvMRE of Glomus versiforme TaxID=2039283 RepID=UPI000ED754D3|nr:ATPase domain-containing protein [endosymbiont GvMRE of Glomus versiforme]RHZ37027.1 Protein RecA [endosymbiont GvMRE of Glomus versiforme]